MMLKSCSTRAARVQTRSAFTPVRSVRAPLVVRAQKQQAQESFLEAGKVAALSAVASSWMFSGKAQAAVELANVAASDNRLGTISLLFLPAIGWVAFNMAQPAFNQLNRMNEIKEEAVGAGGRKKRGLAGAVGLGAALSMMAAQQADAATELSQLAASDNRFGTISLLFLPAIGWVAFNMAQPAFNQLNRMNEIKEEAVGAGGRKKRGLAGAVGLGAALSMMAAQQADAATELSQLAATDNRLGVLSLLFIPALGWVAFNILQPALNQLNRMNEIKDDAKGSSGRGAGGKKKRGLAGAVGLGAALSMMAAQQADAATELSQLAASDNRLGTISLLFLPAIGWVAFNMAQPFFNQLNRMNEIKEEAAGASGGRKKRGLAGAVGLGAALSMMAAQQADAATELMQVAASDNRFGTISLLFLPALGWVAFNMAQPAFNQLNRMNEIKEEAVGATGGKARRR